MNTPQEQYSRNYYANQRDVADSLKYRLNNNELIKRIIDQLSGATYDNNGRVNGYDPNLRLLNEKGIYNIRVILEGQISKNTHLTKYANETRINEQMKSILKKIIDTMTLQRKEWDIKNKDSVLLIIETGILESKLRANEGFENNNVSRSWNVNENIDTTPQAKQSAILPNKSWFGLGGNNG